MRCIVTAIALAMLLGCPPPQPGMQELQPLGLLVTPAEPVVPVGEEIRMVAYAFYEDGNTTDVTNSVHWAILSGFALDVSNELDREGTALGLQAGTSEVIAAWDDIVAEPVVVRVTEADVVGLSITPNDLELYDGDSAWLTATADFSDGSRGDFSGGVRWITADPDVVTIAADGRATGMTDGITHVRAEYEGVAAEPVDIVVYTTDGPESEDPIEENEDPFGDDDDDDDPIGDDDDDDTGSAGDDDTETGEEETGLPDLEITYFSAFIGDDLTYFFIDITNSGSETAGGFYVDLFVDPWFAPELGDDGDDWLWLEGLAPGETTYADFEVEDEPWFGWGSYVIVDTTREVWESDEDDNMEGPLDVS